MTTFMNDIEMRAIEDLYQQIKDEFKVKKIILFGSKARGDAQKYSDIDLLVLAEKPRLQEDRWKLSDVTAEINVDYGVALNCLYFNLKDWELGENVNPLLKQNIEKEGIELGL